MCCAEDTGNRENKARRPLGNLGEGKAVFQDNSLSEAELRTRKGGKPGWRSTGRAREAESTGQRGPPGTPEKPSHKAPSELVLLLTLSTRS